MLSMNIFNHSLSEISAKRRQLHRGRHQMLALALAGVIALFGLTNSAHAGGIIAPGIYQDTLANTLALEGRLNIVDDSQTPIRMVYADLWSNGTTNILDLYDLSADSMGVSITASFKNVLTGPIFSLGDGCQIGDRLVYPIINDFELNIIQFNLSTAAIDLEVVPDPGATSYVTSDCVRRNDDTWIAANDFSLGRIDWHKAGTDGITDFQLEFSYTDPGGDITNPFNGGLRDSHTTNGTDLLSQYQLTTGGIRLARFDTIGQVEEIEAVDSFTLSVGGLFESDLHFAGGDTFFTHNDPERTRVGIDFADSAPQVADGWILTPGSGLSFWGSSVSYIAPPAGQTQVAFTSNGLILGQYNLDGLGTLSLVPEFPFDGVGGPSDSAWSNATGRLYVVGNGSIPFRSSGVGVGTAIATIDVLAVETQALGDDFVPVAVPLMQSKGLLFLMVLLIMLTGLGLYRLQR